MPIHTKQARFARRQLLRSRTARHSPHHRAHLNRRFVGVEPLEDRRMLASDLTTALQTIVKGSASGGEMLVDAIHDRLFDEVLHGTQPVIKDALKVKDAADDQLKTLSTKVQAALASLTAMTEVTSANINTALVGQLGALLRSPIVVTCGASGQMCDTAMPASEVRLMLPLGGTIVEKDTPFELGLPKLLSATGTVHAALRYEADLQLGFKESVGVFFETGTMNEVRLTLDVTSPALNLAGQLGFLRFNATNVGAPAPLFHSDYMVDVIDGPDFNTMLTVSEIPEMALDVTRMGAVLVSVHLAIDMGTALFPTLATDLRVDWPVEAGEPLNEPLVSWGGTPVVAFTDVTINVGSFVDKLVKPVFQQINNTLGPIGDIVSILTTRLPILSDVGLIRQAICGSCSEVTPLTILGVPDDTGFVAAFRAVKDLSTFVAGISTSGDASMGSFTLGADVRTIDSLATVPLNTMPVLPDHPVLNDLRNHANNPAYEGGLSFPFLTRPESAFEILVGRADVSVFQLDLPALNAEGQVLDVFIPILGPLGITIQGDLKVGLNLGFGYDSAGLALWSQHNFQPQMADDVFEGFYLRDWVDGVDVQEAYLEARINALGTLNLGLLKLSAGGGVIGTIGINLHDPNNDGRVHPTEVLQNLQMGALCLFDFGGSIDAALTVSAEFGIGPFSVEFSYDLIRVELVSFDFPCTGPVAPELGVVDPVTHELTLNVGPRSVVPSIAYDSNGNPTVIYIDEDDSFTITHISTDGTTGLETVQIEAYGIKKIYAGVATIFAEGGKGNDTIQMAADVTSRATLYGGFADPVAQALLGDGNDLLVAGLGGGELHGGLGNDELGGIGALGNLLTIYGDEGDDLIHGTPFADALFGGDGNDTIFGNAGDDIIGGGEGMDLILGGEGNDVITGGGGNDDLRGEEGDDTIFGGDADIFGFGGDDIIRGGEGNNVLHGGSGNDTIYALAGNDMIFGEDGNDVVFAGAGIDEIHGGAGNDQLHGEVGEDTIFGDDGDDLLWGDTQNDVLHGGLGNDTIQGWTGNDIIFGDGGDDIVFGGDGLDEIHGGTGNDELRGEGGIDTIFGDDGADHIFGGDGNDTISGGLGNDTIHGEIGDDTITGDDGDDEVHGDDGDDVVYGNAGNDQLFGEAGFDFLVGNDGNDTIYGGAGNDTILGDNGTFAAPAVLIGGTGSDFLFGDDGDDLIFGQGGVDTIQGGEGIDTVFAGTGNDVIHGGAEDDLLYGQDGDDALYGDAGSDFIDGGLGNDAIEGGTGPDRIYGGDGNDTIYGFAVGVGTGDDATADRIYGDGGNDTLYGQGGDDFLDGGAGIDVLGGGLGNDTLVAGTGIGDQLFGDDGDDRLIGSDEGSDLDPNFFDTTYFGDVLDGGNGNDTIFGMGGADYILGGAGDDWVDSGRGSDRIRGGAGNDYLYAGIGLGEFIEGEDGNDTIYGSATEDDTLAGGAGRDAIYGQAGNDTIMGDADDDYLDGGTGTDVIQGNAGNDTLFGGGGVGDSLDGGAGDDVLHGSDDGADILLGSDGRDSLYGHGGNDSLSGGNGDDLLDGGMGDDTLSGDSGSDILIGGAQHDVVYGHSVSGTGDDNAVDYLYGDFGSNRNEAGSGRDRLFGQGGNDYLFGEGDDDFLDGGAGTSNFIDYGAGEGPIPSDFVPPTPTPPPTVQPGTAISHAQVKLPAGTDTRGRWSELAGSGSGDGVSQSSSAGIEPSVAVDALGRRFMAWADSRNGNFEIYVTRHVPGVGWQELPTVSGQSANSGGVSNTVGSSRRPYLAIDIDGNPLVSWTEFNGTTSDIRVAKFDPTAAGGVGAWVALGSSLGSGGISGTGLADSSFVVVTGNGPVVAWLDTTGGVANVYVKRFNGGTWSGLGGAAVASGTGLSQSASSVSHVTAATDGTKVSIAWTQNVSGGSQIYLREFNGTVWNALGSSFSGVGVSNLSGINRTPTVAYHTGSVFVAWQGDAQARPHIFARFWNGSNWQLAAGGSGQAVSPDYGLASQPQLASRGGRLHLVWVDDGRGTATGPNASVFSKQWNGSGLFTAPLEADVRGSSIARSVDGLRLAVDAAGNPLVSWSEPGISAPQVYLRGSFVPVNRVFNASSIVTVQSILDTNGLGPGDVIQVTTNTPGFAVSPADSGVTIVSFAGANITGPVTIAGASDVVLQGISTYNPVTINGGARNSVVSSRLIGGVRLIGGTDHHVVTNVIDCDGVLLNGAVRPIVDGNTITTSPVGIAFVTTATSDAIVRGNRVTASTTGISVSVASSGSIFENDVAGVATGLDLQAAFAGTITRNAFHNATVGVRYAVGAALDENRVYGNTTGVEASVSSTSTGFGFVQLPGNVDTRPNQIYANNIGVQLSGTMQNQIVRDNQTGVAGTGTLVASDFNHGNRIERNVIGVDVTGSIQFNDVGENLTGIVARDQQLIAHNYLYRNSALAVDVSGATATRIVSNTLYAATGDLVRVGGSARETELTNNLFWAESGYAIHVANDSQVGFWSDYNQLHAGANGKLVSWSGFDFTDVLDWQADVAKFDLHSRGRTVVNPGWSEPRFISAASNVFATIALAGLQRHSNPSIDAGDPLTDLGGTLATPANLLTNGSFASGLSGWGTNAGASTGSTNPTSFDASPYFRPGTVAVGFAEQTVNLAAQGFTATQLDSNDYVAVFGGRIRTTGEALPDRGKLVLRFLTAAGSLLSEKTADATKASDRWELVGDRIAIPIGTRQMTYRFEAARDSGTLNDAVLDNAFLRVHADSIAVDVGTTGNTSLDGPTGTSAVAPHLAPPFSRPVPRLGSRSGPGYPLGKLWQRCGSSRTHRPLSGRTPRSGAAQPISRRRLRTTANSSGVPLAAALASARTDFGSKFSSSATKSSWTGPPKTSAYPKIPQRSL